MTTLAQSAAQPAKASGEYLIGGKLPVTRLGYGAMQITGPGVWGDPRDPDEAVRVLRRAVELGVNFIDTADSYGPDVSEQLIKKALHPYPADLVIATKFGQVRPGPGQWVPLGRLPGTSRVAHLEDNIAAAGISLSDDEYAALEAAVR
jgi:aryl-alcohol dehydrogenase-like predicted oxidoreductase